MTDFRKARLETYRANIARYCRMLATPLTDAERAYIHKRIAEERAEMEKFEADSAQSDKNIAIPA